MRTIRKLVMIACLGILLLPLRAMADDYVGFGCTPWDRRSFDIKISRPGLLISVQIWMQGYDDLKNGRHTVLIDNKGGGGDDRHATGRATMQEKVESPDQLSSSERRMPVNLLVSFDELDFRGGGNAAGEIVLPDDRKIPFRGTIADGGFCG